MIWYNVIQYSIIYYIPACRPTGLPEGGRAAAEAPRERELGGKSFDNDDNTNINDNDSNQW